MKAPSCLLVGTALALTCAFAASAQDMPSGGATIPKVLEIEREWLKPGKSGAPHEKTESAFVAAMTRAKSPTHYLALTSMSGKPRALFLTNYASFDAWQKDQEMEAKNPTLSAAIDRAWMNDAEMMEGQDYGIFVFQDEMSLHPKADLSEMRYMEVQLFRVRQGKEKEWAEIVKLVKAAYEKGVPGAHWGMFMEMYGADSGSYLVLESHKSLAEIDEGFAASKAFMAAMGEDGMKRLDELSTEAIESRSRQLFAFSGSMSYVQDEWIKAAPDFWKPRATGMPMAKMPAADAAKPQ